MLARCQPFSLPHSFLLFLFLFLLRALCSTGESLLCNASGKQAAFRKATDEKEKKRTKEKKRKEKKRKEQSPPVPHPPTRFPAQQSIREPWRRSGPRSTRESGKGSEWQGVCVGAAADAGVWVQKGRGWRW